jgi:flagellar secretion chaperone FliS
MPAADARARYLADAVATATPARRIVLLYDRLWLDIQRAQAALDLTASADAAAGRDHLQHAQQIVAELLGSLDTAAWSGAADLAALYGYLLSELIGEGIEARPGRLATVSRIVADLRASWQQAEERLSDGAAGPAREAARVG